MHWDCGMGKLVPVHKTIYYAKLMRDAVERRCEGLIYSIEIGCSGISAP